MVRVSLAGHSLLGLAFGALIYLICLTGTLSVFSAELQRWEQPDAPVVAAVSPEGFARAAAAALDRPGSAAKTIVLFGPTEALPRLMIRVPDHGDNEFADENGAAREKVRTPWTTFVVSLHEELHLPAPWGTLAVALAGAALLALVINGICAHPRVFRDAFYLRLGGPARLSEADLHNRLSVWALPFHIAVTLTGTILALAGLVGPVLLLLAYGGDMNRGIDEVVGPQPQTQHMQHADLPDISGLIRRVEAEHPGAKVSFIMIEQAGTAGQVLHVDSNAPGELASGESYRFSADGRFLGAAGYADGPFAKQMIAALSPLHYGTFGPFPIRLIYGVLGLALCAICATGLNIWLIRRRERGVGSDLWSRAWIAVVWGQPLALAIAALAGITTIISPLVMYLSVTLALFALPMWPIEILVLRRCMRLGTAVSMALLAATSIFMHGTLPADNMAVAVNVALLAGVFSVGLAALSISPRSATKI